MTADFTFHWGPGTQWGKGRVDMQRDGVRVAFAEVTKKRIRSSGETVLQVQMIQSWHPRQGYATRVYEALALKACEQGLSLASDLSRSPAADQFWRKQYVKGRAREVPGTPRDPRVTYVLSCPAPASLARGPR